MESRTVVDEEILDDSLPDDYEVDMTFRGYQLATALKQQDFDDTTSSRGSFNLDYDTPSQDVRLLYYSCLQRLGQKPTSMLRRWQARLEPYPRARNEHDRTQLEVTQRFGTVEVLRFTNDSEGVAITSDASQAGQIERTFFHIPELYDEWRKDSALQTTYRAAWMKDSPEDQMKAFAQDIDTVIFQLEHRRQVSRAWFMQLPGIRWLFDPITTKRLEWLSLLQSFVMNVCLIFISTNYNDNMGKRDPEFVDFEMAGGWTLRSDQAQQVVFAMAYTHAINSAVIVLNNFRVEASFQVAAELEAKKRQNYRILGSSSGGAASLRSLGSLMLGQGLQLPPWLWRLYYCFTVTFYCSRNFYYVMYMALSIYGIWHPRAAGRPFVCAFARRGGGSPLTRLT